MKISELRQLIKEEIKKITSIPHFNNESDISIAFIDLLIDNKEFKNIVSNTLLDLLEGGNIKNIKTILKTKISRFINKPMLYKTYKHELISKNKNLNRQYKMMIEYNDIQDIKKAISTWISLSILWDFNENPIDLAKKLENDTLINKAEKFSINKGKEKFKTMFKNIEK